MKIVILEPIGISLEECQTQLLGHQISEVDSRSWTDEEVIEVAKDAEIIVITNRSLPARIIENLPLLKLISVAFTGIDQIDAASVKERNITVKNASGYAKTAVAELVLGIDRNFGVILLCGAESMAAFRVNSVCRSRILLGC